VKPVEQRALRLTPLPEPVAAASDVSRSASSLGVGAATPVQLSLQERQSTREAIQQSFRADLHSLERESLRK
jgi:hypothetical protein